MFLINFCDEQLVMLRVLEEYECFDKKQGQRLVTESKEQHPRHILWKDVGQDVDRLSFRFGCWCRSEEDLQYGNLKSEKNRVVWSFKQVWFTKRLLLVVKAELMV